VELCHNFENGLIYKAFFLVLN